MLLLLKKKKKRKSCIRRQSILFHTEQEVYNAFLPVTGRCPIDINAHLGVNKWLSYPFLRTTCLQGKGIKLKNLELKQNKQNTLGKTGAEDHPLSCLEIVKYRLGSFLIMVTFMCRGFKSLRGTSTHFIFHLLKLLTTSIYFNTYFQGHSVQNAVVTKTSKQKTKGSSCLHRVRF